jgi:iron complex transport system ATP-binding protein
MSACVDELVRLSVSGVVVEIAGKRLLDDVSIDVHAGELVALCGPNGAGKSTLLAVMCGDRRPTTGTVRLDGADLRSYDAIELARRRSLLPQSTVTVFGFSATEVVAMGRFPWPSAGVDDERAVRGALARVGATWLAERAYPTLSGGEQTLTNLARVIVQDAGVVLLDEPTAALDLHHQEVVMDIARSLASEGRAVIVVLHELNLAARHCDRIVVLSRGRVVADGPPSRALVPDLLGEVYGHRVAVVAHPLGDPTPLVLPLGATTPRPTATVLTAGERS